MTNDAFIDRTDYLPGAPCLIDTEQPDPEAAAEFYGGLFGWEFENKLPTGQICPVRHENAAPEVHAVSHSSQWTSSSGSPAISAATQSTSVTPLTSVV